MKEAVGYWSKEPKLSAVLQMGDIVDGSNRPDRTNSADAALEKVLSALGGLDCEIYHVVGNNEIRNFAKEQLGEGKLRLKDNPDAGGVSACYLCRMHVCMCHVYGGKDALAPISLTRLCDVYGG